MANPEVLFRSALLADADAAAFFTAVEVLHAPQKTRVPYVIITLVGASRTPPLKGKDTLPVARLDVEVIADDRQQLAQGRGIVRKRMDALIFGDITSCHFVDEMTDYEDRINYPRSVMEFRMSYKEVD